MSDTLNHEAAARIAELEADCDEYAVIVETQREQIEELIEENRALKAQVRGLLADVRYPDLGVA